MPTAAFNICCPRDCVSRHKGGTVGAPLKPLRDDSALGALSTLSAACFPEEFDSQFLQSGIILFLTFYALPLKYQKDVTEDMSPTKISIQWNATWKNDTNIYIQDCQKKQALTIGPQINNSN